MAQVSNPKNDRRSLTHSFHEVGDDNGVLRTNTPNVNSPVLEWTCPRKYDSIRYAGGRHKTKFIPRTKQEMTGSAADDTVVTLTADIQPIHGETDPQDWSYDPVVAYNKTQDMEVEIASYDFSANEVTLATDPADGDTVLLYPIMAEGTLQYRGLDQFGHEISPLDEWSTPIHVFHDFEQGRNETEVHLIGAAQWKESETLALYINSPHEIVWEDADYPRGKYASSIEQRVDVSV